MSPGRSSMELMQVGRDGAELRRYPLRNGEILMGRRPDCNIVLDAPSVAPRHARVFSVDGRSVLYGFGAEWPVYVNGVAVNRHVLAHGDVIELAHYRLCYVDHESGGEEGLEAGQRAPVPLESEEAAPRAAEEPRADAAVGGGAPFESRADYEPHLETIPGDASLPAETVEPADIPPDGAGEPAVEAADIPAPDGTSHAAPPHALDPLTEGTEIDLPPATEDDIVPGTAADEKVPSAAPNAEAGADALATAGGMPAVPEDEFAPESYAPLEESPEPWDTDPDIIAPLLVSEGAATESPSGDRNGPDELFSEAPGEETNAVSVDDEAAEAPPDEARPPVDFTWIWGSGHTNPDEAHPEPSGPDREDTPDSAPGNEGPGEAAAAPARPAAVHLDILSGINQGRRITLTRETVVLGFNRERLVEIRRTNGTLWVRRIAEQAEAQLNGEPISDESTTAEPGDVLSVQRIVMRIHRDQ